MSERRPDVNLRQLEVFVRIHELGSFSRAAAALGLSQPTVSAHVRSLEEELGARLFQREGRGIRVTAAGDRLYVPARRLVEERDRAIAAVMGEEGELHGDLAVAASSIPGSYIVPRFVAALCERHPAVRVTLSIGDSRSVARRVRDGGCEIGVVGSEPDRAVVDATPAGEDRLVLVAPPGHPLAGRTVAAPRLIGERFVVRAGGSGSRDAAEGALPEDVAQGLVPVLVVDSNVSAREAVRAGVGLAFLSELAVRDDLKGEAVARVRLRGVSIRRRFHVILRQGRPPSDLARAFLDVVAEE
ncbi:MAG: LysR substrate-binding domain-containing protein [Planctomycetota bacterium JB042]